MLINPKRYYVRVVNDQGSVLFQFKSNPLGPRQYDCYFADGVFKSNFAVRKLLCFDSN